MNSSEPIRSQLIALWIGPELSSLERACLSSATRCGHPVALYCYERPRGVPRDVEIRDASEILPRSAIIRHSGGSPALFANRFRYKLLKRGLGTWIDCDLYFVAPLADPADYLMAEQGGGKINSAVLRIPPDSPLLDNLLAIFAERSVPPWLPWRSRWMARYRLMATGRSGIEKMPWGSAGPEALTYWVNAMRLAHHVLPASRFYPAPWTEAKWIFEQGRSVEDVIHSDTVAVHLWSERLKGHSLGRAPADSFAARLVDEAAAA